MNGFELNKIAGAVLLAGLIAMVAGTVAEKLYKPEHHGEEPEKRGFTIAGAEESAAPGAANAAEPAAPVDILPLLAAANAEKGKEISKKCAACHSFDKGGKNMVGPNLWGVVGAAQGHRAEGFAYSATLSGLSGKWDYQQLSQFLENPQKYAKGTKMAFAGVKKPEERADLIMFLRSLSDSPAPLP